MQQLLNAEIWVKNLLSFDSFHSNILAMTQSIIKLFKAVINLYLCRLEYVSLLIISHFHPIIIF